MVKMTMLHFASPFAVTTPKLAGSASGAARSVSMAHAPMADREDRTSQNTEAATPPSGADRVSVVAMDGPVDPVGTADLPPITQDAVLRRYAEQRGDPVPEAKPSAAIGQNATSDQVSEAAAEADGAT